jgi:hypothetical protein
LSGNYRCFIAHFMPCEDDSDGVQLKIHCAAALGAINAPTEAILDRPLIGNGANGGPGQNGGAGGLLYGMM